MFLNQLEVCSQASVTSSFYVVDTSSYVGGSSEGIVLLESGTLVMSEYGGGLTMTGCRMISSTGLLVAVGGSMMSQVQLTADSPVSKK